jgi:hypothetical protein
MTAIVILSAAVMCVRGKCYPALVGHTTPLGTYTVHRRLTDAPGYGGDVLVFAEDDRSIYAIHRVWLLHPSEHRMERLHSQNASARREITNGCINVMPKVYNQLGDIDRIIIVR